MINALLQAFEQDISPLIKGEDLVYLCGSTTVEKQQFAAARQLARFRKKFKDPSISVEKAIQDFVMTNELAGQSVVTLKDPVIIGEARDFIYEALRRYTKNYTDVPQAICLPELFLTSWKYGKGSNNGLEGTHFCEKVGQTQTITPKAERLYRLLRYLNPHLRLYDKSRDDYNLVLVQGNKTSTVPKNEDTLRTIGIEPSGNMKLQLGVAAYLEGALRSMGINISANSTKLLNKHLEALIGLSTYTQAELNNQLARIGSIDGSLATMDLKSASDLILIALVKLLWPYEWVEIFLLLRSEFSELPDGRVIKLNMMSTMGNGFTFPMMTLTLTALLYGLARKNGMTKRHRLDKNRYGVFGDDIILPTELYGDMVTVLQQCGLIVNLDKSYSCGDFRESCGGDYFKGEDVTPFYIKSLNHDSEIYSAINGLLKWSARHKIFVFRTLRCLVGLLSGKPLFVPQWHDPSSGIMVAGCPRNYKYLSPVQKYKSLNECSQLEMLAALGGYAESIGRKATVTGLTSWYLPRPHKAIWKTRRAKLPKGFLDGHCHVYMSVDETLWCSHMLAATLGR